jgi:hypothetical protein
VSKCCVVAEYYLPFRLAGCGKVDRSTLSTFPQPLLHLELGFGVRVVVENMRPRVGLGDTQIRHQEGHRFGSHRAAPVSLVGAGVHESGKEHRDKPITRSGRKEPRWAMIEAAWRAVRSSPYWKKQFEALKRRKHPDQAGRQGIP